MHILTCLFQEIRRLDTKTGDSSYNCQIRASTVSHPVIFWCAGYLAVLFLVMLEYSPVAAMCLRAATCSLLCSVLEGEIQVCCRI